MQWQTLPALIASAVMMSFGIGAAVRPTSLEWVGITAVSPLGRSEVRAVFGGMFVALGAACLLTREPLVFAVAGGAWLADVAVRTVSVAVDRVPMREAVVVLAIGAVMGVSLASGYWFA